MKDSILLIMQLFSSLLAFRCIICEKRLNTYGLCNWCNPKLYKNSNKNYCKICMTELCKSISICNFCKNFPPPYKNIEHIWDYNVQSRNVIKEIKYNNNEALLKLISKIFLKQAINHYNDQNFDYICPMPESYQTSKRRKYNLCFYLAKKLSQELSINITTDIKKKRNVKPQAALDIKARIKNVRKSFYLKKNRIQNKKILIIDDVITSGASIMEITKLCRQNNVSQISFIALARSPNWHKERYILEKRSAL